MFKDKEDYMTHNYNDSRKKQVYAFLKLFISVKSITKINVRYPNTFEISMTISLFSF